MIVATDHGLPLVNANLQVAAGATADPEQATGSASLTADLVTKGAGTRSATQVAQAIEALGAELSSSAGWDSSSVSLSVRSDRLEQAAPILHDVVVAPTFAAAEVDRQRKQAIDALTVSLSSPGTLANIAANRALYGAAPYGRMQGGTPKSLAAIDASQVAEFHRTWWRPDNAVLVLSGDITPEQGFALAQRSFGDWAKPSAPLPAAAVADTAAAQGPRMVVVDRPDAGQAAVVATRRGIARKDADYFPLLVANNILGGGYSARLNQEIRIKRGLSYGARSGLGARLGAGPISASAQTKNPSAPEVVDLMLAEFARMGEPAPAAELTARKAVLIGNFGRQTETNDGLADALSELALYGLPLSTLGEYVAQVQAVTAEQVQAAGRKWFAPEAATVVVAGDAKEFLAPLKGKHPEVEVLSAERLDLDSATLK